MTSFWDAAMACRPTIQWLDVDGINIRVVTAGPDRGPAAEKPVILIHGGSDHLEAYVRTLPVLAGYSRMVAYGLPPARAIPDTAAGRTTCSTTPATSPGWWTCSACPPCRSSPSRFGAAIARVVVEALLPVDRLILIGAASRQNTSKPGSTHRGPCSAACRGKSWLSRRLPGRCRPHCRKASASTSNNRGSSTSRLTIAKVLGGYCAEGNSSAKISVRASMNSAIR